MKTLKAKMFVGTIGLFCLVFWAFMYAGCSGGANVGGSGYEGAGAFAMRVNWPDGINNKEPAYNASPGGRFIPDDTQTIFVSITGFGIAPGLPITSSISYPQSSVLIENIPAGPKVALIRALDGNSKVLSQRKESFIIRNGQTEQGGNISLGVAIRLEQGTGNVIFEPSSLAVPGSADISFQNWTSSAVTITGFGSGGNLSLSGAFTDGTGKWTFDEEERNVSSGSSLALSNGAAVLTITGGLSGWVAFADTEKFPFPPPFTAAKVDYTSLKIDNNGVLYLAYQDQAEDNKATVIKWSGTTWELVGVRGFSAGSASFTSLALDGSGNPVVAYRDAPFGIFKCRIFLRYQRGLLRPCFRMKSVRTSRRQGHFLRRISQGN